MKRLIAVVAVLVGVSTAPPAHAHPIRECGDYGYTRSGAGPFFRSDGSIEGAGVYNITSRAVRCSTADKIVKRVTRHCSGSVCHVGTFTCRTHQIGEESSDTRCTSTRSRHYVVRWQFGA